MDFNKSTNLSIDKGTAIITYNKYKGYTFPLLVIAISVLMLFFIVIPEINQFFASKKQLDEETQKLNVLKNNYNFLTNLNENRADMNLRTLTRVLPTEKDFFGIMTSVSHAASIAGIAIENYKFYLGSLSKTSQEAVQYPTIIMTMTSNGEGYSMNKFINELYKTAPLVEVSSVKFKDGRGSLNLAFYYKPFPPQKVSNDTPVSQLTPKEQQLLEKVSLWNNLSNEGQGFWQGTTINSTISGEINFEATESSQVEFSPFN